MNINDIKNAPPDAADDLSKEAIKRTIRLREQAKREVLAESQPVAPVLSSVTGNELPTATFALREPLLHRQTTNGDVVVLRAGHIAQIHALRGIGKTWFLMLIALMLSTTGEALGFVAKQRRRVLYIDGEMASEDIRGRFKHLSDLTKMPLTDYLEIVASDWQDEYLPRLDTPIGQVAVEPFIDRADVVIIDNRSCLFDSEGEKDATAWQPAGDYLLSLRRRGKALLIAHHANRQGGARGHSKAEDPMDLLIKLTRPDDYTADQGARFLVEFEKTRGFYGEAASSFVAALTDQGWEIQSQADDAAGALKKKAIGMLATLEKAGDPLPTSGNRFCTLIGGNREAALKLWAELIADGTITGDRKSGFRLKF